MEGINVETSNLVEEVKNAANTEKISEHFVSEKFEDIGERAIQRIREKPNFTDLRNLQFS